MSDDKWRAIARPEGGTRTQAERFYDRYWRWIVDSGYYRNAPPPRLHVALGMLRELAPQTDSGERLWVDAGCADGKLGRLVREAGIPFTSTGVDISETALEMAREHYDGVARWDATAGPLTEVVEPGSVAAITCLDVLEHLFDPGQAVAEFHEALRPGGLLVVATPNFVHYASRLTVLRGRFPSEEQHIFHEADHLHYFTGSSFTELVESAGFDVLAVEGTVFRLPRGLDRIDRRLGGRIGKARPTLFARQLVLAARRPG